MCLQCKKESKKLPNTWAKYFLKNGENRSIYPVIRGSIQTSIEKNCRNAYSDADGHIMNATSWN